MKYTRGRFCSLPRRERVYRRWKTPGCAQFAQLVDLGVPGSLRITELGLLMKSEIEKCLEQVQTSK